MTQDGYQKVTLKDKTPGGPELYGYHSWAELHNDHNFSQVERFKAICDQFGLEWKEQLTLKDVCDYLLQVGEQSGT